MRSNREMRRMLNSALARLTPKLGEEGITKLMHELKDRAYAELGKGKTDCEYGERLIELLYKHDADQK